MNRKKRLLVITVSALAALVVLGFWLPSFNQWEVKDIPLLIRAVEQEPSFEPRLLNTLDDLMTTEEGLRTAIEACASTDYMTAQCANWYFSQHSRINIRDFEDPEKILDILVEYTGHENRTIRTIAYDNLDRAIQWRVRFLDNENILDYVPLVTKAFLDEENSVRNTGLYRLASLGHDSPEVRSELVNLLEDDNESVRTYAACTLTQLEPENLAPIPVLIQALESDDENLVLVAADNIEVYKENAIEALPMLVQLLGTEFTEIRSLEIARAIVSIGPGDGSIIPDLIPLIDSPGEETRSNVFWILEKFGSVSAPALPDLYRHTDPGVETDPNLRGDAQDAIRVIEAAIRMESPDEFQLNDLQGGESDGEE